MLGDIRHKKPQVLAAPIPKSTGSNTFQNLCGRIHGGLDPVNRHLAKQWQVTDTRQKAPNCVHL